MSIASTLPVGRNGQVLAAALTVLAAGLLWLVAGAPLLDWYGERAERLRDRETLATRMAAVAATRPALRRQASAGPAETRPALLQAASEPLADAALQQRVQELADRFGVRLASAEVLPAQPSGALRRLAVHVAVSAPWPSLVALLAALDEGTPRMLVDDVRIDMSHALATARVRPLDASLTVIALYAGAGQK